MITEKKAQALVALLRRIISSQVCTPHPGYSDVFREVVGSLQQPSYWAVHEQRLADGVTQQLPFEALVNWHELQGLPKLQALLDQDYTDGIVGVTDTLLSLWFIQVLKVIYGRTNVVARRLCSLCDIDSEERLVRVWSYVLTIHHKGNGVIASEFLTVGSALNERLNVKDRSLITRRSQADGSILSPSDWLSSRGKAA